MRASAQTQACVSPDAIGDATGDAAEDAVQTPWAGREIQVFWRGNKACPVRVYDAMTSPMTEISPLPTSRPLAVGDYVRYWPQGDQHPSWAEGRVVRLGGTIDLERALSMSIEFLSSTGWTSLRQGSRIDLSCTIGSTIRCVRAWRRPGAPDLEILDSLSWVCLAQTSEVGERTMELWNNEGVRADLTLLRSAARTSRGDSWCQARFSASDPRRAEAASLRATAQILDAAAERARRGVRVLDVEGLASRSQAGLIRVGGSDGSAALLDAFGSIEFA